MKEIVSTKRFVEVIDKMSDIARIEGRHLVLNDALIDIVSMTEQNEEELFCSAWIVRENGCELAHYCGRLKEKMDAWRHQVYDVYFIRKDASGYQMVILSEDEWKDSETLTKCFYGFLRKK